MASLLAMLIVLFHVAGAFEAEEYTARLRRAQAMMQDEGLSALFLTMEAHHFYFTGVQTEFFKSPTRPYYLVVPAEGKIIAVVPSAIAALYESSPTVGRILTWNSPRPHDEGISLLVNVLKDMAVATSLGSWRKELMVGAELGSEIDLRMPHNDFERLQKLLNRKAIIQDASLLLRRLRLIKSEAEIALQKEICEIQSQALENIPNVLRAGMTEREASRRTRIELLKHGADRVEYIACRSGPGGYTDIIGAATDRVLQEGDVLFIDVGSVLGDYFCDFNRNWYVGWEVPPEIKKTQETLYAALDAGIQAAVPGNTTADVFHAMVSKLPGKVGNVGRMGHSVGLVITEWPSIMAETKETKAVMLEEGMIFALEPALGYGESGQFLVHEEDVVIRKDGAQLTSRRGPREMPLITAGLASRDV